MVEDEEPCEPATEGIGRSPSISILKLKLDAFLE